MFFISLKVSPCPNYQSTINIYLDGKNLRITRSKIFSKIPVFSLFGEKYIANVQASFNGAIIVHLQ